MPHCQSFVGQLVEQSQSRSRSLEILLQQKAALGAEGGRTNLHFCSEAGLILHEVEVKAQTISCYHCILHSVAVNTFKASGVTQTTCYVITFLKNSYMCSGIRSLSINKSAFV